MQTIHPAGESHANGTASNMTRWIPSAILDLPPGEWVTALRTPHRVLLQALPSSRETLLGLLAPKTFEIHVELEDDDAPLRQAPANDAHGAFLTPDLPLEWPLFYWLVDGLQEDLESPDPSSGFQRGRARLAMAETMLRRARRGRPADVETITGLWDAAVAAGTAGIATAPVATASPVTTPADASAVTHSNTNTNTGTVTSADSGANGDAPPDPGAFVSNFATQLLENSHTPAFVDAVRPWLQSAERNTDLALPALAARETRILSAYAQHRLFGAGWLAAPAGLIAGWQLFVATHVMAVWFAGLAARTQRGKSTDALATALSLLDQGLWRDDALVYQLVRGVVKANATSPEFTLALTGLLSRALVRV